MHSTNLIIPPDATPEELELLEIVKERMLQRLGDDRCRFIFIMVYELGKSQIETARALGVHETEVSRQMKNIRARLYAFRKGYPKL